MGDKIINPNYIEEKLENNNLIVFKKQEDYIELPNRGHYHLFPCKNSGEHEETIHSIIYGVAPKEGSYKVEEMNKFLVNFIESFSPLKPSKIRRFKSMYEYYPEYSFDKLPIAIRDFYDKYMIQKGYKEIIGERNATLLFCEDIAIRKYYRKETVIITDEEYYRRMSKKSYEKNIELAKEVIIDTSISSNELTRHIHLDFYPISEYITGDRFQASDSFKKLLPKTKKNIFSEALARIIENCWLRGIRHYCSHSRRYISNI